jgi:hypothetical protein
MVHRSACTHVILWALSWIAWWSPLSAQEAAFPLEIGPTGRYFVDQKRMPFYVHGDTPWSITHNLTFEEAVRYMQARKAQGFNTFLVSTPDAYGPDGTNSYVPDRYGQQPFIEEDLTRPNEVYWAHVERVFREAERQGFLLFVTPAYLGAAQDGYVDLLKKAGPRRSGEYGRWLGRRFRALSNIVWVHGGDRNPWDVRDEVRALALGIREVDRRHLHTGHWTNGTAAFDYFADEGWLDFNSSYTYGPVAWRVLFDRHVHPPRPTFLIESHYENEWGGKTAKDIRAYPYRTLLAGGAGDFYGSKPTWYCGQGWEEALDLPGARYMSYAMALFRSRPWFELEPDNKHQLVVRDHWESGDDTGVQAALTRDRTSALIYLPPDRREIGIDLEVFAARHVRAYLFDPSTGASTLIGVWRARGTQTFTAPGENDWVLVLDDVAKRYGPPGEKRLH